MSVTCMMYAEHVLRIKVDWSTLGALNEKKFGGIGIAFTKCSSRYFIYSRSGVVQEGFLTSG